MQAPFKTSIFAFGLKIFKGLNIILMTFFSKRLLAWYRENKRELPWRETKDPYRIWVSEIILQQTRVSQGYEYYCRFTERFPDVYALAAADEDEVMKYWQGLGYYSRARNLHTAARSIVDNGGFPKTYKEVRALKGVGDYTAAAICSFAFGLPCAVVDGNVYRVLSRWLGIDIPIDTAAGKKYFASVADELLDKSQPGLYNQAIMDFGALQCVPASPSCVSCPLADSCVALQKGLVGNLPMKQHKTKISERFFYYIYVHSEKVAFIRKRNGEDIWRNLYEFPLIEAGKELEDNELFSLPDWDRLFDGCTVERISLIEKRVKHVLSHRIIYATCYDVTINNGDKLAGDYREVMIADLHKFPVSRLISRFFSIILKPNKRKLCH